MKKRLNNIQLFLGMMLVTLLSACGVKTMTPQELIDKNDEAMDDIESVEVILNSAGRWHQIQVDRQEDIVYHTLESEDITFTYNQDVLMAKNSSGFVTQKGEEVREKFLHDLEFMLKPFDFLRILDEEIMDKFIVADEDENEITIVYNSAEYVEDANKLSEQIVLLLQHSLEQVETEQRLGKIEDEYEPLELELTIDKSDNLLRKFNLQVFPIEESQVNTPPIDLVMTYHSYNQDFDIVMFEETDSSLPQEVEEPVRSSDLTEEEAVAYLEALIQATVYQNATAFTELAPQSMGADRIKSDAVIFRDTFKSIYVDNSQQAWSWTEVAIPDEQHEALAEAFLTAIAKTEYEIIEQKQGDDGVIVTLQVHGINDTEINEKAAMAMIELFESGEVSQAEALDKLFEDLIYAYNNVDELEEPVSVDVEVYKINENFVVEQDDYLIGGFVQ